MWEDDYIDCPDCGGEMCKIWKHAPIVDAKMPFYVESLGKTFTTHMEMDRYAQSVGKVVEKVDGRHLQHTVRKTVEERISDGQKKAGLREHISRAAYRVRHGYKDYAPMTTEAQLAKETP